jgi:hypothetical protein
MGGLGERLALLIALASIVVSVGSVAVQLRRQRLLNSAAMVTDFVDKYGATQMREDRRALATMLIAHLDSGQGQMPEYAPVLGFFENIGYLARHHVLDVGMLHNKFGFDVLRWHAALTRRGDLIQAYRDQLDEPTIYREIDWLGAAFSKIDKRLGKRGGHAVAMESVTSFLEQECCLSHL